MSFASTTSAGASVDFKLLVVILSAFLCVISREFLDALKMETFKPFPFNHRITELRFMFIVLTAPLILSVVVIKPKSSALNASYSL